MIRYSKKTSVSRFNQLLVRYNSTKIGNPYLAKTSEQPDASATILSDLVPESKRVQKFSKKATWLQALKERQKQLALGKVLDSYSYTTPGTTEIKEKKRSDSFSFILLPFKEDSWLLDSYVNAFGRLRVGQLFQDLDALAGVIAYKHCSPAEPMIVTASVDRICMLQRVDDIEKYNILVSGSVVWVGRSSMEIQIKASFTEDSFPENENEITEDYVNEDNILLSANFTFVARNPETHKSFPINKFLPLNEKQWLDFSRAESHNAAKKFSAKRGLLDSNAPTESESNLMHELWKATDKLNEKYKRTGKHPKNVSFMNDTVLKSVIFMQPQYRNRHSYMIFGGYLMKQAFELAYCCAAAFSHAPPRFVSLDSTAFTAPVPVGSVLYMKSRVVYTEHLGDLSSVQDENVDILKSSQSFRPTASDPKDFLSKPGTLIQVQVDTSVRPLDHDDTKKTGTFVFSYFVPRYSYENESLGVKKSEHKVIDHGYYAVLPESYSDMMKYIEGKRRAKETAESFAQLKS